MADWKVIPLPSNKLESWHYSNFANDLAELNPAGFTCDGLAFEASGTMFADVCEQPEFSLVKISNSYSPQVGLLEIDKDGDYKIENAPRVKIIVKAGVNANLLQIFRTGNKWNNVVTEAHLEAGAKLTHTRIQQESADTIHTGHLLVNVSKEADYRAVNINVGAKKSRVMAQVNLRGETSNCGFKNINLGNQKQHQDTTLEVIHHQPNCTSDVEHKALAAGQSKSIFQGKFHVKNAAQKTDANMQCKGMLLGEKAMNITKPELEIYADDVKCAHGSSSGQIDAEMLFFMQSRGLSESVAKSLLMHGFIASIVDEITSPEHHQHATQIINNWLENHA